VQASHACKHEAVFGFPCRTAFANPNLSLTDFKEVVSKVDTFWKVDTKEVTKEASQGVRKLIRDVIGFRVQRRAILGSSNVDDVEKFIVGLLNEDIEAVATVVSALNGV
jgi:hypothetical protein